MKKIIFIVVLVLFTNLSFAVELWNGFTSEMNKEDVIQHARDILSVTRQPNEVSPYTSAFSSWNDGNKYPKTERMLIYTSLPAYSQNSWCLGNMGGNLIVYFFNDKLFCIEILWAAAKDDALNKAKVQYGDPTKSFMSGYKELGQHTAYYWKLTNKDFVVDNERYYFIDRDARLKWEEEQKKISEQKKAAEEKKRKLAADGITF